MNTSLKIWLKWLTVCLKKILVTTNCLNERKLTLWLNWNRWKLRAVSVLKNFANVLNLISRYFRLVCEWKLIFDCWLVISRLFLCICDKELIDKILEQTQNFYTKLVALGQVWEWILDRFLPTTTDMLQLRLHSTEVLL